MILQCTQCLNLVNEMLPRTEAKGGETFVLMLKMRADNFRYCAEFSSENPLMQKEASIMAKKGYIEA